MKKPDSGERDPSLPKVTWLRSGRRWGDSDSFTPFVGDERKQGWWFITPSSTGLLSEQRDGPLGEQRDRPLGGQRDAILAGSTGIR